MTEDQTKEKNSETESDEGVTVEEVKEVLARHTDAQVVIFYGTLPANYSRLDTKAEFFLFDTGAADTNRVKKDIEGGKILGVIVGKQNTGIKSSDPVEKDPTEAFNKRYILVEKSNIKNNDKNL